MPTGRCAVCERQLLGRNQKYCAEHSHLASTIWKRAQRRLWKAAGDPYWQSDWKDQDARRAYHRAYMREYRRRHRDKVGGDQ